MIDKEAIGKIVAKYLVIFSHNYIFKVKIFVQTCHFTIGVPTLKVKNKFITFK